MNNKEKPPPQITRREFIFGPIRFVAKNAFPIITLGVLSKCGYDVWQYDLKKNETKITTAPVIQRYLEDDLTSQETYNLGLLRTTNRQELVKLIHDENEELWSTDRNKSWFSRWKLTSIVEDDLLGTHSRVSDDYFKTPQQLEEFHGRLKNESERFFGLLDDVTRGIDRNKVSQASLNQQANMWVEAVMRAQCFESTSEDPSQPDGVYVSTYIALYGMLSDFHFVSLQSHQ